MKVTKKRLAEIIKEEILREVVSRRVRDAIGRAYETKNLNELDEIWEAHEDNRFDPESEFYITRDDREAIKEAWHDVAGTNNK